MSGECQGVAQGKLLLPGPGMAGLLTKRGSATKRGNSPNGYDQAQKGEAEVKEKKYSDARTKLIIKAIFGEYCPACGRYLKEVDRELTRLRASNPEDAELVRKVAQLIVEFLTMTDQLDINMESFTEQKWNLHAGNMHSEYCKVATETFRTDINWGRILMFLGFAVSFAVYLEEGTVVGSADSVMEWTCQVVEEELGAFFTTNQGWVSGNVPWPP